MAILFFNSNILSLLNLPDTFPILLSLFAIIFFIRINVRKANTNKVRTRFKFATNVTDNGKEYIGAVYYDEVSTFGNLWRLIYITEKGEEQAFYGAGANDPNTVPASWVKYSFLFGHIKIN